MTENYINNQFDDIVSNANAIEQRLCDDVTKEALLQDNAEVLEMCKKYNLNYIEIDETYSINCLDFLDTII